MLKFDSNSNTCVERYLTELMSLNFTAYSILPTHCNGDNASLLDHVFMNFGFSDSNNSRIKSLTVTSDITDHYANIIGIASKNQRLNYANRPFIRIYSSSNINKFQHCMSMIDWSVIFNLDPLDDTVIKFTEILTHTFDKCFPLVKCSRKKFKDKCWVTKDLNRQITIKNNLFIKFKKSKNTDDERSYKSYKQVLDKQLENARQKYFQNLMNSRYNSTKYIWRNINKICSYKNQCKQNCINFIQSDQGPVSDNNDIANIFNNYFSTIGTSLASKIDKSNISFNIFLSTPAPQSMFLNAVTNIEVFNAIMALKDTIVLLELTS